jgi:esterase
MSESQLLYFRDMGDQTKPALCLLHGLFGSSSNWMGIVSRLQEDYRIIVPDLRNHGRSAHHAEMDYPAMAEDVISLLDHLGLQSVALLGHSMGGKAAMWTALVQPERIDKLIVADIAPVTYKNRFSMIFSGLSGLSMGQLQSREQADLQLSAWISDQGIRQYLLQNLVKQEHGWAWRFNLPVLQAAQPSLSGFPDMGQSVYPGDVLFIHGECSDYVSDEVLPVIHRYFPHYRQRVVHGAGHWLYSEQPDHFSQAVRHFLK